jgi:aryl-alcohol dehydrogenase-like predicted oxidoreductase
MKALGDSKLEITPLGIGTWAIGGDWAFGWGPQDDAHSIAAIRAGVERGMNWIDTAPIYGFGHSEEIVARALREIGHARRPLVFTKCGMIWDDRGNVAHCLEANSVRREVESSLRRLDADVLDLCQIHWPSFPPGEPAPDIERAWEMLAKLKEQGKLRHMGVSNFDVSQLERVQTIAPVTSLQPPYSMLMRQIEDEILPYCQQQGIGVIAYSPLHNGLLSGRMTRERIATLAETDWRKHANPAFQEPHLSRNLELVEFLRGIAGRHQRSVAEVAVAWTLRHPAVTGTIVGVRRAEQVDGLLAAMDFRLSEDEIAEIEAQLPPSLDMMSLA